MRHFKKLPKLWDNQADELTFGAMRQGCGGLREMEQKTKTKKELIL